MIVVAPAVVVLQGVLVRILLISTLTSALFVVGCGGSANPLAPSVSVGQHPTADQSEPLLPRNSIQRVEEGGGGGGGQCLVSPSTICGVLSLTAGDVTFEHNDVTVTPTANPLEFTVTGDLQATGGGYGRSDQPNPGGHFATAHIQMTVTNGSALVELTLEGLNDQASFVTTGTGPASSTCASGVLTTRVTLQLKYLGTTEIIERHARDCGA
jgi:hypothetical protein